MRCDPCSGGEKRKASKCGMTLYSESDKLKILPYHLGFLTRSVLENSHCTIRQ